MRLPNKYGQIIKLSGKRRNPFAVYPPATRYNEETGSAIREKAIGYYHTRKEALEALTEWHQSPTIQPDATFTDIYNAWSKEKFKENLSHSSVIAYTWAYSASSALHDRIYSELRREDFQAVVDACKLGYGSCCNFLKLFKQMGKFALANDYVNKDYAQFCKINKSDDTQKGIPFTEDDIRLIWNNYKAFPDLEIVLILIYTGLRINELKTAKIDFEQNIIVGGSKTKAGKSRIVPIHSKILPFLQKFDQNEYNSDKYRQYFYGALKAIKIDSVDGVRHTPHDCRHTFSWLCDKYKMNNVTKHMIMGHALKGVEDNIYGHRTIEEMREELEKIKIPEL